MNTIKHFDMPGWSCRYDSMHVSSCHARQITTLPIEGHSFFKAKLNQFQVAHTQANAFVASLPLS
jgi:hypothetical protein